MAPKRKCPVCEVSVNLENLGAHLAKVHPLERVPVLLREQERRAVRRSKRVPMARGTRRLLTLAAFVVIAFVLALIVAPTFMPPAGGRIHLEPTVFDFGDIGQSVVSTTFRIHNRGESNLVLLGASTSCMCTTARVLYGDRSSPTFGFHDNPAGWSLALPPGAEATLQVFYDPTVHPEFGHFERQVYVLSSDPAQREATVTIHVNEV